MSNKTVLFFAAMFSLGIVTACSTVEKIDPAKLRQACEAAETLCKNLPSPSPNASPAAETHTG